MSASELVNFEEVIKGEPDEFRWQVAVYFGMRQGEALGMTWDRIIGVDTDQPVVDVYWALSRVPYICGCGARKPHIKAAKTNCPEPILDLDANQEQREIAEPHYLLSPKTKRSRRVIPVPVWMHESLRRRHREYMEQRTQPGYKDHGLVFSNHLGRNVSQSADNKHWHRLLDEAGIEQMPLHGGRHTAASALMRAGADPKTIQDILGHSDFITTMGYQHTNLEHLASAFEGLKKPPKKAKKRGKKKPKE